MTPSWLRLLEGFFTDIWNIACDFFWSELGVTSGDFKLFDVDRCEDVFLDDLFGDEDRILEVVTIPWHEGHEDVTTDGKFTVFSGSTVCDDMTFFDWLTLLTIGFWLKQVPALERMNLRRW